MYFQRLFVNEPIHSRKWESQDFFGPKFRKYRPHPPPPPTKKVPSITNTIIPHHASEARFINLRVFTTSGCDPSEVESKWNLYKMVTRGATQQRFIRRGSVRRMSNPLLPFHIPFLAQTAVYGEERCVTILKRPRGRLLFEQNLNVQTIIGSTPRELQQD